MAYASWTGSLPQVLMSGQFGTSATNLHVSIPYSRLVTHIFRKKKRIQNVQVPFPSTERGIESG